MDTIILVIQIPIPGYLYILLPILKFHINDTKDTDTKRYQDRYKKSGKFLIRPSNLFFRLIRHMIQDAKMVKDTGNLKKTHLNSPISQELLILHNQVKLFSLFRMGVASL